MEKEVSANLSLGRSIILIFLGICLGIGLTLGTFFGIREYAPEYLPKVATFFLGSGIPQITQSPGESGRQMALDPKIVGSIVQDILASDQGKVIIRDIMNSESRETLLSLLQEAMQSSEFRKALSDSLQSFLETQEGKELIKKIAKEALTP